MRLTCPNCSAQYDIADDMIPAGGRDVQCSNCATTWFQEGRSRPAASEPRAEVRRPAQKPDTTRQAPAVDRQMPDDWSEPSASPDTGGGADAPAPVAEDPAPRRPLADQKTLDILRQERAHEARKRAAERRRKTPSTPDPDEIDDSVEASRAAAAAERARMATAASVARARQAVSAASDPEDVAPMPTPKAKGPAPAVEAPPADDNDDVADAIAMAMQDAVGDEAPDDFDDGLEPDPAAGNRLSRRDLLPDIEEINSSLRPDERAMEANGVTEDDEPEPVAATSGFGVGFMIVMFLVIVAAGIYAFAPQIAGLIPGSAETLASYVAWVDTKRIALEASVNDLTARILPAD